MDLDPNGDPYDSNDEKSVMAFRQSIISRTSIQSKNRPSRKSTVIFADELGDDSDGKNSALEHVLNKV